MGEGKQISVENAYARAAALCSRAEKCISEIRTKLFQWKLPVEEHDKVIDRLIDERFIDEKRFVRGYVNDKFRYNKWGRVKIAYHLAGKSIDKQLVKKTMDEVINEDEYIIMLKELVKAKERSISYKDEYDKKQKLLRFIAGRGFEPFLASELID